MSREKDATEVAAAATALQGAAAALAREERQSTNPYELWRAKREYANAYCSFLRLAAKMMADHQPPDPGVQPPTPNDIWSESPMFGVHDTDE